VGRGIGEGMQGLQEEACEETGRRMGKETRIVFEGPVSRLEKDRDWTGPRLEKTRTRQDQDRKRPQRDRF